MRQPNYIIRDAHQGAQMMAQHPFTNFSKGLLVYDALELLGRVARGIDAERVKLSKSLGLYDLTSEDARKHENYAKFESRFAELMETESEVPDMRRITITQKDVEGLNMPPALTGPMRRVGIFEFVDEDSPDDTKVTPIEQGQRAVG